ncbi:transmembrane protein 255B [Enhydra lutris kenyoni]|uniref:Transmembrane protein 255B n=1 Tax=Enhydra lutris kenyoni TaxID=391180 RepID=A0A2Y9JBK2_ENHLU|nr:transmembrane protein 255B [Enhydra lutris kenyoni]
MALGLPPRHSVRMVACLAGVTFTGRPTWWGRAVCPCQRRAQRQPLESGGLHHKCCIHKSGSGIKPRVLLSASLTGVKHRQPPRTGHRDGGPYPGTQPPVPGPLALLDTTEGFVRRKKASLRFVGSLLVVSAAILTVGLAATTRTENVTVGGYYPGIILGFGAFLGIIGLNLVENRRQMLVAAIVFVSFGVVAAFCCAIVDGVFVARHIEPRPLTAGRCEFFASEAGYMRDAYQTEVTCHSSSGSCPLKVKSGSCYCCELYRCQSTEHPPIYYEFVGVRSCPDVLHLYQLLWASSVLNVLGALLGVLTAAVLGAFKDMVPLSQLAYGPSAPPQTLYNPAQQILAYAGFCRAPAALPTCSSYPLPLQDTQEGLSVLTGANGRKQKSGCSPRVSVSHVLSLRGHLWEQRCPGDSLVTRGAHVPQVCGVGAALALLLLIEESGSTLRPLPRLDSQGPPVSEDVPPPDAPPLRASPLPPGVKPPPPLPDTWG